MSHQPSQHSETEALDSLIFANRKLEAVRLLRQRRGLNLAEGIAALKSRYKQLRAESPDRFTCDDAEYWRGFHS